MRYLKKLTRTIILVSAITATSLGFVAPSFAAPTPGEGGGGGPATNSTTSAQQAACEGSGGTWDAATTTCTSPDNRTVTGTLQQVINILIFIVGAIAVIMVVIGSIRYTVAQGDQAAVASAKNTIIYAIVGIVIAVAAYGIVNFVTNQFK